MLLFLCPEHGAFIVSEICFRVFLCRNPPTTFLTEGVRTASKHKKQIVLSFVSFVDSPIQSSLWPSLNSVHVVNLQTRKRIGLGDFATVKVQLKEVLRHADSSLVVFYEY